jgi:methionyl-tRNA synthetase
VPACRLHSVLCIGFGFHGLTLHFISTIISFPRSSNHSISFTGMSAFPDPSASASATGTTPTATLGELAHNLAKCTVTDMASKTPEELEYMRKYVPRDDTTISYGALAHNLPGCGPEKYYLTTAISYTNGYPHIGHAYEFLTADVLVRYHRVLGYDTYFLTGSDEHGQKVANSAEVAGRTPIQHCDIFVGAFKALMQRLAVKYSNYIRTTDSYHEETCQKLWKMCSDRGDIYLDKYEGWYNEREECFVADGEAEAANFCDPGSGLPLKRVTEENYFFRQGRYADALIAHIEANPSFIEPEQYRNNILARLKKEGLKDLCISRTAFSWGVPVPEGFDQKHVMYVWFDALTNYVSGVYGLDPSNPLSSYWPTVLHIIGKDIIWFHCVIWPCMLMSAGVALPRRVFSHGFVNAADGRKMSKSYNNTVEPHQILDKYSSDSVRYYFCASTTYGLDVNFNEATLIAMHNSELADILGNLVHRALNLCLKYCDGVIPETSHDTAFGLPFNLESLVSSVKNSAANCAINESLFAAMDAARATNKYLTDAEPWKMKGADEARRPAVVRTTLEAIYAFAHFLAPVIPTAADSVFTKLNTAPVVVGTLKNDFYNLSPGTPVTLGDILFKKIEIPEETSTPTNSSAAVTPTSGSNKGKGVPSAKKVAAAEEAPDDPNQPIISKLDLRVGRIVKVWNHETADRLYCEEIDIGEAAGPRQVCSGLRQHYALEQMQDRLVIVVCNLKEAKMQGFVSAGMVLAAKSCDSAGNAVVQLVSPPSDAVIGDRVCVANLHALSTASANRVKKLKIWETIAPDLAVDAAGQLVFRGDRLVTATGEGVCSVESLTNAPVS